MDHSELGDTTGTNVERSTADIREDIARGGQNISKTVEQIGELIHEKLDWREYVKDSPYWSIGAGAGLGYLASGMFLARTTPMERIIGSLAKEIRYSLGGLLAGAAGLGLIKATLRDIAAKSATQWIQKTISTSETNSKERLD